MFKKRAISVLLALVLAFFCAACAEQDNNPTETSTVPDEGKPSAATTVTTTPTDILNTTAPTEADTQQITYAANLPDDIILTIEGKSTSAIGKRGKEIFAELDVIYAEQTMYDETDYPNGIPYDLWYRGADTEGWTFVTLGEWFVHDRTEVILRTVTVTYGALNCPNISLLGIANDATEQDLFMILGSPEQTVNAGRNTDTHYWRDLQIGNAKIESISANVVKGIVTELTVTFAAD